VKELQWHKDELKRLKAANTLLAEKDTIAYGYENWERNEVLRKENASLLEELNAYKEVVRVSLNKEA